MTYDIEVAYEKFLAEVFPEVAASSPQGEDIKTVWFGATLQFYVKQTQAIENCEVQQFLLDVQTQLNDFMSMLPK